jgi:hypothetical protein
MATYSFGTKDLSVRSARAFLKAMSASDGRSTKNSYIIYAAIGKSSNWSTEPLPEEVSSSDANIHYNIQKDLIGAKRVDTGSVSHVTTRYDWQSGTIYDMYKSSVNSMHSKRFYVMTDEYNVYKCLFNNSGAVSTVRPTGYSTLPFTTSDGYVWKYLYTISLGEAEKFLTASHIPVKTITNPDASPEQTRQAAVQNAAVNGAIEIIETESAGSGYSQVIGGNVLVGGSTTLQISGSGVSAVEGFYNGSSVYISQGPGLGQLRRIDKYVGPTRTLTVNAAFTTPPTTDSIVNISPSVTIIGDGSGAQAYSKLNETTGSVDDVTIINVGSGYTKADVKITANSVHGSGATANAILSPMGGHGKDPVRELGADKLCLNVKFNANEGISANGNGYIPSNTSFRTISILKDPILKVNSNNEHQQVESVANTSNSPNNLRLTTRATISYISELPVEQRLVAKDIITNERNRLSAELGTLEFVTELGLEQRKGLSMANALQGANAEIVYIRDDETQSDTSFFTMYLNNVNSYGPHIPFTKDDVVLEKGNDTALGTIEFIKGPEANTCSGEVIYTESVQPVSRTPDQTEDIKIILDF